MVGIAYNLRYRATSLIIGLPGSKSRPSSVELSLNPLNQGYRTLIKCIFGKAYDFCHLSLLRSNNIAIDWNTQVNPQWLWCGPTLPDYRSLQCLCGSKRSSSFYKLVGSGMIQKQSHCVLKPHHIGIMVV